MFTPHTLSSMFQNIRLVLAATSVDHLVDRTHAHGAAEELVHRAERAGVRAAAAVKKEPNW